MTENLMNIQTQGRQAIVELAMQLVQRLLVRRDVPFAHAFVHTNWLFDSTSITASSRWDMDQRGQQHMILSRIIGLLGTFVLIYLA